MSIGSTAWSRPVASFAGLLVAYYAFPVDWSGSPVLIAISLALTAIGLAVLSWMMVIELRRLHAGQEGRATGVLILMLGVLIMVFAMSFYLLERLAPAQFSGLVTRTDALYFTLTTMTTVGFGDVHAQGQLARVLVCGLIVFNVVVIAALVRALTSRRTPTP